MEHLPIRLQLELFSVAIPSAPSHDVPVGDASAAQTPSSHLKVADFGAKEAGEERSMTRNSTQASSRESLHEAYD